MAAEQARICCVEGIYGYEDTDTEPSIKPMLELLTQWGYWPHVYERCRLIAQAEAFLADSWSRSGDGSVLYFATHGCPGSITLSSEREPVSLQELGRSECLAGQCVGCYVHFSACDVLEDGAAVGDFLEATGASAVSGYRTDVGWADSRKPAVPLDLMLFNLLWEAGIDFSDRRSFKPKLAKIEEDLQRRFGDCQFRIKTA